MEEEKKKNPVGAPRRTSFAPEEMIELGREMVQWVGEHPEILHLSAWYSIHKGFLYKEWKTFIQRPEFIPYYEQALNTVGQKYLDKNSNVREGISQRWQRVYFKDIKEEEDETFQNKLDKEFEQKKKLMDHQNKSENPDSLTPEQIKERKQKIIDAKD